MAAATQNTDATPGSDNLIKWQPGQSGNPGGRPKGISRRFREIAGDDAAKIGEMLYAAAVNGYVDYTDKDGKVVHEKVAFSERMTAAREFTARGWGKPPEFVPIESDDPLELAASAAEQVAEEFDQRMDELAARRAKAA